MRGTVRPPAEPDCDSEYGSSVRRYRYDLAVHQMRRADSKILTRIEGHLVLLRELELR